MKKLSIYILTIVSATLLLMGVYNSSAEDGQKIYNEYCATCHGADLQGGLSQSLADGKWLFGSDDLSIKNNIKKGIDDRGMPEFGKILSESELDKVVAFIRDQENHFKKPDYDFVSVLSTFDYEVKVELVSNEVSEPWAIAFISTNKALVTEKPGNLRIIENGKLNPKSVSGIPKVLYAGQGGLLDVAVDPEYEKNGWIYLSFSHETDGNGMTKLVRGKLNGLEWIDEQVIFEAPGKLYVNTRHHFGSRIVFDDKGHLFFSIGDRGVRSDAQDLSKPNGKIHRIYKDGSIPKDNPFFGDSEKFQTIFAYGNRNPQGLSINPETGDLWESEHGQMGGDEINIINSGKNYGWDTITYGRNYDGTVSTEQVKLPGMEIPILFWRPSIAVCGIDFYKGNLFEKWDNHLIVGALKYEEVRLLDIEDNRVIHEETILKDAGRVRDVCTAPDGSIYVVLNQPDEILRLTPEK